MVGVFGKPLVNSLGAVKDDHRLICMQCQHLSVLRSTLCEERNTPYCDSSLLTETNVVYQFNPLI